MAIAAVPAGEVAAAVAVAVSTGAEEQEAAERAAEGKTGSSSNSRSC